MICPKCGSEIRNNFCIKCGYNNLSESHNINKKQTKRKDYRWLFKLILVLLILLPFVIIIGKDHQKRSWITPISELKYNSENYINDLYISDEHVYKNLLNKDEKELYRKFLNKIKNFEKELTLDLSQYDFTSNYFATEYFININNAIFMDHPEILYYAYISYQRITEDIYKISFTYVLDENKYEKAIDEVKIHLKNIKSETKNMSDYEKVEYVYNWLGKRNDYDDSKSAMSQSAYSAFNLELSPVCAGFSRASQIIFQNIGIESLLISGSLNNIRHEWNFVKLDNQYYYFDVTQSGTNIKPIKNDLSYSGFLFKNHKGYNINNKDVIPLALGRKYLYKK